MMKKFGVILLALCMFSVSVFADEQAFNPTVDVQRSEVQMDSAYRAFLLTRPDEQCNSDCMSAKERTQITANLEVIGDVSEYGDTFIARASVTNVGAKPAYYVVGYFTADGMNGLPEGWIVNNNDGKNFTVWEIIMPGETKSMDFSITRDEQDATLVFKALGQNCVKATSQRVKVPVDPLVLGGLAVSMTGMYAISRRKKEFA